MRLVAVLLGLVAILGCRPAAEEGAGEHAAHRTETAADAHAGHAQPAEAARTVTVEPAVRAALGLRTATPRRGSTALAARVPATVRWDPLALTRITTRFAGQVRRLDLPREGERVDAGRVVARIDSPQARALFAELAVASDLGSPWREAARDRLVALGIERQEVDRALEGTPPDLLPIRSAVGGVVVERLATPGAWLPAGAALASVAASDALVVEATVTGAEVPQIGTPVELVDPTTGERWTARVLSRLPTGGAAGASIRVRLENGSPSVGRPYVIEWSTPSEVGLWIPRSAVTDTGSRRVVFVAASGGYEPRDVQLGRRAGDQVEVLEGLAETDEVVVAGTFLLDSETQVGAAGHGQH